MLKDKIDRLREIVDLLDEDDPDRDEILNNDGDYSGLMEWALIKRNEYISRAEANKALAETYTNRRKAFEKRSDGMKDIVTVLMNAAGQTKYQGTAATVSIKSVPPKPIVLDESLIPDDYFEIKKVLNKTLVNQAVKDGYSIDGIGMDNGGITTAIRSK